MINSSRKLSALILLLVLLCSGGIPRAQVGETVIFETDEIQKLLNENKIPTLGIGVIRGGKLTEVKVFGELSKGMTAPFDTIFNVASLTKPVTAMVALKLASAGKLNLDEPLDKYWIDPDVKDDPRHKKLTARLVLSHRTGFANWRWLNKSKKLEFAFEPGTKYQYSGEGFEYLRKALEKKFNEPLETLADELIFRPLGMRDTRFTWDAKMDATRFAPGYDKQGNAYEISRRTKANAADDLLTTVEDYGKFLVSVMNSDGLSKPIFDEMVGHQIKTKENKYFGLGWEIYDLGDNEYALSHGGSDEGANTLVFLLPKSRQGLIIFTNSDNGTSVYLKLIALYLKDNGKRIIDIEMKTG
ncbi:MAG TPA: serine hydrolase domain-containing protein [Pyrinomonadaceae bacterium]|jgi:CubicO group peptidase (beta-lactamase class C family)